MKIVDCTSFYSEHMMFSVIDHKLVPKHENINIQELNVIFKLYKINDIDKQKDFINSLPLISATDPVSNWLGGVPKSEKNNIGTIFKITRKNGDITYRRTINDFGL